MNDAAVRAYVTILLDLVEALNEELDKVPFEDASGGRLAVVRANRSLIKSTREVLKQGARDPK